MLIWRSGQHVGGETGDWFNWHAKFLWLISVLRDRWYWFDVASLAVVVILLVAKFGRGFLANIAVLRRPEGQGAMSRLTVR